MLFEFLMFEHTAHLKLVSYRLAVDAKSCSPSSLLLSSWNILTLLVTGHGRLPNAGDFFQWCFMTKAVRLLLIGPWTETCRDPWNLPLFFLARPWKILQFLAVMLCTAVRWMRQPSTELLRTNGTQLACARQFFLKHCVHTEGSYGRG